MTTYTEREKSIIRYYQETWQRFAKDNEETHPIFCFAGNDETGFIYPQELDAMIERGCESFIVHVWHGNGMYGHDTYDMHKSIMDIELEDEKENTMPETKQEMNAVEFLKQELNRVLPSEYFEVYEQIVFDDLARAEIFLTKERKFPSGEISLTLKKDGKFNMSWYSGNQDNVSNISAFANDLIRVDGIALKWQALHATDESLDSEDDSESEDMYK